MRIGDVPASAEPIVERRDLARRPLAGEELRGLAALVFDPPRAGARHRNE